MRFALALLLALVAPLGWSASSAWLFVGNGNPYTTNYYVDSVAGNDTSNGLTPATAFQTLAKMQTLAGSIPQWTDIHLKRGSVWTGAAAFLQIAQANTKVEDYGTGALPKIDGRIAIPAANWSLTPTTANTYQYAYSPPSVSATAATQLNIWENGIRLARAASQAAVETTAGSYFVPSEASFTYGTPTNIFVHSSDNTSPITNGKTYSTQGVTWALYLGDQTNVNAKLYNVECMGGCHHNGNVQLGRNSYAQGVTVRWGTIHSLYTDSGFFVSCISYDDEQGFDFVANKGSSSNGFIEMNGCISDISATTAIVANPAFFVHGDTFATIRYINCTSRAHAIGFGVNGCPAGQQVLISGCQVFEASASAVQEFHAFDMNNGTVSPTNSTTININNCLADGYGFFLYGLGWNSVTTCVVDQARFIERKNQVCVQYRAANVEVKYSSFYAPANVGYSGLELDAAATANWHNNIVDGFGMGTEQFTTPTYSAANNVWHYTNGTTPPMRASGTYYATFAAYQTAWEATATNADPAWNATPSTAYDFSLQLGSPAISRSAGYTFGP